MSGYRTKAEGGWHSLLAAEVVSEPVTLSVIGPAGSNPWGQSNLACQIKTTVTATITELTFYAVSSASRGGYAGVASAQPTSTVAWIGKAAITGGVYDGAGTYTVTLDAPVPMTAGVDYWLVLQGCALNTRYILASEIGSAVMTGLTKDATETFWYGTSFGSSWSDGGYPQITLVGSA